MAKNKEPSQRQLRIGEEIRHILSDIILRGEVDHEDLFNVSVTVTEVDVSPDLRNAIAYVSPLGGANSGNQTAIIKALNEASPSFNHHLAKRMAIKFTPRLKFIADTRFDYAEKIENLLNTLK